MSREAALEFRIRPVEPSDYEALGELTVAAYHDVAPDMPGQDEYDVRLRDVERRARESCVLVAVTRDGQVLGGTTYVSGPEDPYSEELRDDEAGMRMLAVDPAAQRRGVGRALTGECLQRARAAGKRRLVLHTGPWMPGAIRMYESMGFVRDPSIDFTPVPGIDLLAYVFVLAEE
jgi:ribosomal protein S18 acetylase RimI-like enzyme